MGPHQVRMRLARLATQLAAPSPHPGPEPPAQGRRPLPAAATTQCASGGEEGLLRVAPFEFDVTPPLGTPLMDGGVAAAAEIRTPLTARGVVLLGVAGMPPPPPHTHTHTHHHHPTT